MGTILRNSAFLFVGEGIRLLSIFLVLVAAARELGAFGYGQFSYAYALAGILGILATLGFPDVLVREIVQRREERLFSTLLLLQIGFGVLVLGVLGGAAALFLWGEDSVVAKSLLLLLVFFLAQAGIFSVGAFFRARQRMEQEAMVRGGGALLLLALGLAVLKFSPGVQQLAAAYAAAGILAVAGTLLVFHVRVRALRFHMDWPTWKEFLLLSWPVGITVVLGSVLGSVDSVMLGLFGQVQEVGWYNAGYRIASLAAVPAALVGASFFPVLSRGALLARGFLRPVFFRYLGAMVVLGVPVSAAGMALAPVVIDALYGQGFAPAAPALQLLFGAVLMQFFYLPFFFLLLAANRVHALLVVVGVATAGNILLNAFLIPPFSLYGAAAASAVSYAFMAGATGLVSFRKVL